MSALGRRSNHVRRIRRLLAKRAERTREGAFVVEGPRVVAAALDAGADLEAVYVEAGAADRFADLLAAARTRGVPVHELQPDVVEAVTDAVSPQPVVAVARMPAVDADGWAGFPDDPVPLVVVLADVREPGNAGTVVRSAEAAGATAVVFCEGSTDPWSPKVVRSSAGSLFYVPVVRAGEAGEVLEVLAQRGLRRLGTAARGGSDPDRVDWTVPTALVLGNEAHGLPDPVAAHLDATVTIPMAGRSESLNVAMSASVLLFTAAAARRRAGSEAPAAGAGGQPAGGHGGGPGS